MFKWTELNKGNSLYSHTQEIIEEWINLINKTDVKEGDCAKFLKENAGFFFSNSHGGFSISELQLGKDYKVDFTLVQPQYSIGNQYTLIELENPTDKVFKKKGNSSYEPTQRLSTALSQIRNWDKWLQNYKEQAIETFPTVKVHMTHEATYKFRIIIGRRSTDPKILEQIHYFNKRYGVEIRSFDSLTEECLKYRFFSNYYDPMDGLSKINPKLANEYFNPFYKSYSSKSWTEIVREKNFHEEHIISRNIGKLLEYREYNQDRLEKFKNAYEELDIKKLEE